MACLIDFQLAILHQITTQKEKGKTNSPMKTKDLGNLAEERSISKFMPHPISNINQRRIIMYRNSLMKRTLEFIAFPPQQTQEQNFNTYA